MTIEQIRQWVSREKSRAWMRDFDHLLKCQIIEACLRFYEGWESDPADTLQPIICAIAKLIDSPPLYFRLRWLIVGAHGASAFPSGLNARIVLEEIVDPERSKLLNAVLREWERAQRYGKGADADLAKERPFGDRPTSRTDRELLSLMTGIPIGGKYQPLIPYWGTYGAADLPHKERMQHATR